MTRKDEILLRLKAIVEELKSTPRPILGESSLEDWDEVAQAKLEYGWWYDEIIAERNALGVELTDLQTRFINLNVTEDKQ